MFRNRPYRRQRPPGTTPNASKFWFLELVDSRKILAGVCAQAVRSLYDSGIYYRVRQLQPL